MVTTVTHQCIPVVRQLPADLETTISVYLKLASRGPSFLLDSVTGGEQVARYSFVGTDIRRAFVLQDGCWEVRTPDGASRLPLRPSQTPLQALHDHLGSASLYKDAGLPRFIGGLVGYLGYETVRYIEPGLPLAPPTDTPEAIFLQADTIVAFDHAYDKLLMIAIAQDEGDRLTAEDRLDDLQGRLASPVPGDGRAQVGAHAPAEVPIPVHAPSAGLLSNQSRTEYCQAVEAAQKYITAGDSFQVVLSQRLSRQTGAHPFDIYRQLRRINPSPYMFFFDFSALSGNQPFYLLGASPEMHVRLEGDIASLRPIAGTRPRGSTPQEDLALESDLLSDPKERAEHFMLVDLGRNDLGRVCQYGTVHVPQQLTVERYSHVMHIVSHISGKLRPGLNAFDLLEATFPAGTVSGAPKVRAMEIIHELEPGPRGPYAGAVGYISYDGSCDTCIAIRTLVMQGQTISVQAGAGIVADSLPENEYQESMNKARALFAAVDEAERINPCSC